MIKGVIFDLDDTLYFEVDYVKSGFKEVSRYIGEKRIYDSRKIYRFLLNSFKKGVRGNNFNLLLERFPFIKEYFDVDDLVYLYRTHRPKIKILREAEALIKDLREKGYLLGIITDGYLVSQKNKIDSLNISHYFDVIIYTGEFGRQFWKPNEFAFQLVANKLGLPHYKLCYVGDNPEKDFLAPNKLGWLTVRFKHHKQLHYYKEAADEFQNPKLVISNLLDLRIFLMKNT